MYDNSTTFVAAPQTAGTFFSGAVSAAAPSSATSTLTGFASCGYISEDGYTVSNERSTEEAKAFGGITVRTLQTDFSATITLTLLQVISKEVLELLYGPENVTVTPGDGSTPTTYQVKVTGEMLEERSFVVQSRDTNGRAVRHYIPRGQISSQGEFTFSHGELTSVEITITAYKTDEYGYAMMFVENGAAVTAPAP